MNKESPNRGVQVLTIYCWGCAFYQFVVSEPTSNHCIAEVEQVSVHLTVFGIVLQNRFVVLATVVNAND
jgi:hypothetical protein